MDHLTQVLFVEDSRDVLEINRQYFEMAGYCVMTAMTLAEAQRRMEKAIPDIIVLDIMLPDGSGLDFCGELRRYSPVPVLFPTCLDEEDQIIAGLKTGWARNAITFAASHGLISGTDEDAFSPNEFITRADFVTTLGVLSGADVSAYKDGRFDDVQNSDPAMPYIE